MHTPKHTRKSHSHTPILSLHCVCTYSIYCSIDSSSLLGSCGTVGAQPPNHKQFGFIGRRQQAALTVKLPVFVALLLHDTSFCGNNSMPLYCYDCWEAKRIGSEIVYHYSYSSLDLHF